MDGVESRIQAGRIEQVIAKILEFLERYVVLVQHCKQMIVYLIFSDSEPAQDPRG